MVYLVNILQYTNYKTNSNWQWQPLFPTQFVNINDIEKHLLYIPQSNQLLQTQAIGLSKIIPHQ